MKKIPLTQGKFALVDERDHWFLSQWKWSYVKGYAIRQTRASEGKRRTVSMHRAVLARVLGHCDFEDTDHINQQKCDNRRANLRAATRSQNNCNQHKQSNNRSGYKGVSWHKKTRKWRAYIAINKKHVHLGVYESKKEAATVYNKAAKKHYGEFAILNEV